jgi:hypothetical protein
LGSLFFIPKKPYWRPETGYGFFKGGLISFYAHSLYWLARHAGVVQLNADLFRDGEAVIFAEFTPPELLRLIETAGLRDLRRHPWGLSWRFLKQPRGADDDFSGFDLWRETIIRHLARPQAADQAEYRPA